MKRGGTSNGEKTLENKPATVVLLQDSTELLIEELPLQRLVWNITKTFSRNVEHESSALSVIQEASEAYLKSQF